MHWENCGRKMEICSCWVGGGGTACGRRLFLVRYNLESSTKQVIKSTPRTIDFQKLCDGNNNSDYVHAIQKIINDQYLQKWQIK